MDELKGLSLEDLKAKAEETKAKVADLNAKEVAELSVADVDAWSDELEAAITEAGAIDAEIEARETSAAKAAGLKAKADELAAKEAEKKAAEAAAEEEAAKAKEEADKVAAEEAEAAAKAEEEAKAAEAAAEAAKKAEEEAAAKAKAEEELTITPGGTQIPESHKPKASETQEDQRAHTTLTASAGVPKVEAGTILDSDSLVQAIMNKRHQIKNGANDGEFVTVASAFAEYEEGRILPGNSWEANFDVINKTSGTDAIVAAGGICAPATPYYELEVLSEACRPVREALVGYSAPRGAITFMSPPSLADVNDSARITTEEEDRAGYNVSGEDDSLVDPKPSVHVACDDINTAVIDAISSILVVGNLQDRTYPEQVAAWVKLAAARHAQVAEINLLDKIAAVGTNVTAAKAYGATRTLLSNIDQAVAGFKSRHRICNGVALRILLPKWVHELLRVDLARQAPGDGLEHFFVSDAQIDSWFAARGVVASFYQDSATGAGQTYGAQGASALTDFPTTVKWYLYAEGTFLFLDGGELNLGLVRDHTLNTQNDYSLFFESFEGLAFVGHEALEVTTTLEPDGTYAPTATAVTI